MNLKETKIYFETLFADVWDCTPVHFVGEEFDSADRPEWVNPLYRPLSSRKNGVSTTASIDLGQLYVVCWAEYELEAFALSDKVIEFVKSEVDASQFKMQSYKISDNGWDDSNKVFVVLAFTFEHFNGTC